MKRVLPWLVRWARFPDTRDFYPDLAALVRREKKFFSLTTHFFTLWIPIAQQPARAVVPGRLSLNMYLREKESVAGIQNECFRGESISQNLS
jgi:hypothetical protein